MQRLTWLAVLIIVCVGCGPKTATVSGTVTVDGTPLDKGVIAFAPLDGAGDPVSGNIENGKYSLTMIRGKKAIQFSAPKVVGKRKEYNGPGAPEMDIIQESLPDRYNAQAELTLDVTASMTKDWNLEGKK